MTQKTLLWKHMDLIGLPGSTAVTTTLGDKGWKPLSTFLKLGIFN